MKKFLTLSHLQMVLAAIDNRFYKLENNKNTLSISNNIITITDSNKNTSSITLPVYDGSVT